MGLGPVPFPQGGSQPGREDPSPQGMDPGKVLVLGDHLRLAEETLLRQLGEISSPQGRPFPAGNGPQGQCQPGRGDPSPQGRPLFSEHDSLLLKDCVSLAEETRPSLLRKDPSQGRTLSSRKSPLLALFPASPTSSGKSLLLKERVLAKSLLLKDSVSLAKRPLLLRREPRASPSPPRAARPPRPYRARCRRPAARPGCARTRRPRT